MASQRLVMIVDDECAVGMTIDRHLERAGYEHIYFQDAKLAMSCFMDNYEGLDLAILDLAMPGINGVQMAERMHKVRPDLPIIIITGHLEENTEVEVGPVVKKVLHKPFTRDQLLDIVREYLDE